jgi:hypothetical protein
MNYRLAPGIDLEEQGDGGLLLASRPLRLVQLNRPLLRLARRLQTESVTPASAAEATVLETLAKRGFVTRLWPELTEAELPKVSIVIPVKDRPVDLRHCLESLAALDYPQEKLEIIVVDDGSSDTTPQVACELGARLLHSGAVGGGPAAARNRGAQEAQGEILAFIDSDCTASPQWLRQLLPVFATPQVAAVGGWVDGMRSAASLDRYEAVMSSLNLGRRAMTGGAGGTPSISPPATCWCARKLMRPPAASAPSSRSARTSISPGGCAMPGAASSISPPVRSVMPIAAASGPS